MTGPISKDIATEKYHPVIRGVAVREHAQHYQQIYLAFTVRKKMFMFKVYTAANILGWACLTWTLREHLCGAMEHHLISITGPTNNQTT